jgi:hypothetical protein
MKDNKKDIRKKKDMEESPKVKEELALITTYHTEQVTERVLEEGVYKYKQYQIHYHKQSYGKIYKEEGEDKIR